MPSSPSDRFSLIQNVLQELYHLEFTLLHTEEDAAAFCRQHSFHPVQKEFSLSGIHKIVRDTRPDTLFHLIDTFLIQTVYFFLDDVPVIMGPFCSTILSQKDIRFLLSGQNLPSIDSDNLLRYTGRYPVISESTAIRIVRAVLHTLYPHEDDRPLITTDIHQIQQGDPGTSNAAQRAYYELLLEKRYTYEKKFRKAIGDGNQRSALLNLANMEMDVSYLKRIGSTMENERIGSAIARTTARLAAIDSGLPGIVADRISSQNTKETFQAKTREEIQKAKEQMICEYCTAVRAQKKDRYSVLIQSILYEFDHNFHNNLSLDELAQELAVSKNYLIRRFREETGTTPIRYLNSLRLTRAALLLEERALSVQDIANAVGIPDSNYFIKLFKKQYQMTPSQYRKSKVI